MPDSPSILLLTQRYYLKFVAIAKLLQPFALLLIRLAWGWEMLESGYRHLTHFQGVVEYFRDDLHIPLPALNAAISSSTELIGGALLMVGLGARLISLPLVINFCVAIATAGHDNLAHIFSQNPEAIVNDTAFPFLATSLIILAFGPGCFSLDALISRLLKGFGPQQPQGTMSPYGRSPATL